jgi:hypothetical protein
MAPSPAPQVYLVSSQRSQWLRTSLVKGRGGGSRGPGRGAPRAGEGRFVRGPYTLDGAHEFARPDCTTSEEYSELELLFWFLYASYFLIIDLGIHRSSSVFMGTALRCASTFIFVICFCGCCFYQYLASALDATFRSIHSHRNFRSSL